MKLTKRSEFLVSFLIKNKCIPALCTNKINTNKILIYFYLLMKQANDYLYLLKQKKGNFFYSVQIKERKEVRKPTTFLSHGFPKEVKNYIEEKIKLELEYSFYLLDRNIKIYFLLEDPLTNMDKYNKYVDNILIWMIILHNFATPICAPQLTIFIYLTDLQKELPITQASILDEFHINTAFTKTCPTKSEIVIFRKEEWFKVFLHETFHNLGLDFSDMNNEIVRKEILKLFPVSSEVNLYEAYAEFWAKIMNIVFCSYLSLNNPPKDNRELFIINFQTRIQLEQSFSCLQMIKVLDFMNLDYNTIYKKGTKFELARNKYYKEKTNVLAYYVITYILLNNYCKFMDWCFHNNNSILQFKKSLNNQLSLCNFIIMNYKTTYLLDSIECMEDFYHKLKEKRKKSGKKDKDLDFILSNLRLSVYEIK